MKTLLISAALGLPLFSIGAAADEVPTVQLLMKEGHVIPETLEVPANTKFRLEVKNEGPGSVEFESGPLKKEVVIAQGTTKTLVIQPLKPGSYKFHDDFHQKSGQGSLVAK
ncbi:MAG: cupredoxin domain-containing protein [Rhodocyclaceae bacterium]|nr:MAG: cupredoxin domain-containing protein [Rhodocyclaceae bacterium]